MKYKSEKEILRVVKSFENGTIAREDWGHPEHLLVAFYYSVNHDFETALAKMRAGIFNLLKAFAIDLTREMPYHETMTVFWMRTVYDFANSRSNGSVVESCAEMIETYDKNYPLRFYSRELLFSENARERFVGGDLAN